MSTFEEQFVAMTVATLKADGKAALSEVAAIKFLAEGLDLDGKVVDSLINLEAKKDTDVIQVAKLVADENKEIIMEACIIVALADKSLEAKEVELLLNIAKVMGVAESEVVLRIASVAQNNREIRIQGNEGAYDTPDEIEVED